jgi:hypothetical protein
MKIKKMSLFVRQKRRSLFYFIVLSMESEQNKNPRWFCRIVGLVAFVLILKQRKIICNLEEKRKYKKF